MQYLDLIIYIMKRISFRGAEKVKNALTIKVHCDRIYNEVKFALL